MKRLLFCISLLIYIHTNLSGQAIIGFNITHGRPSIRSITPLSPTAYNESAQGTTFNLDSIIDEIQYYDGLGRPMQVVQRAMSPEAYYIRIADGSGIIDETITINKDLVVHQEYDAAGRQSTSWLPTVSSYAGALIPLDILKENAKNLYQDSAYSRPVYEASPLNRVSEQYGPGKRWYNSSKSIKTEYLTNKGTSGELSCIWFAVDGQGMNTTLNKKGYYNNAELFVTKMTNEEGSISYEFKDKLGQVLLTRQINTNSELLDTYYVYDDLGNLSFVIPPIPSEMATKGNLSTENLDLYGYQYKYNIRSWTQTITNELFKQKLDYDFSGNIENMVWEQNDRNRSYTFEYDKISRLTGAVYKGVANENYSTTYSYDKHGNMKSLTRMGMVNNKPELIDDLSFDYTGNQRLSVEDHIRDILDNSSMDFKDYNKKVDIPVEYTYNTNGAMTMDMNKGIQNIKYNILNLPQEVEIEHPTAKAKNTYTYIL